MVKSKGNKIHPPASKAPWLESHTSATCFYIFVQTIFRGAGWCVFCFWARCFPLFPAKLCWPAAGCSFMKVVSIHLSNIWQESKYMYFTKCQKCPPVMSLHIIYANSSRTYTKTCYLRHIKNVKVLKQRDPSSHTGYGGDSCSLPLLWWMPSLRRPPAAPDLIAHT